MIRQWNVGKQFYKNSRTFVPTPGDFHLFILSKGITIGYLHQIMVEEKIPRENIIYQSIECENDVHPGASQNQLVIIKT